MEFKVKCVGYKTNEKFFTIGKTYEWKDGKLTNDNGFTYSGSYPVGGEDVEKWGLSGWYTFKKINTSPAKILITTDSHTTTARLYDGKKVTKTAEAKCSPDDKFDFGTGAKLAFDRLMGTEKPKEHKPESIKLYCVKSTEHPYFTRGQVYTALNHNFNGCFLNGSLSDYEAMFPSVRGCLVPLVSRPAKVGEWVYILPACSGTIYSHKGEIFRVNKTSQRQNGGVFVCIKENPEAPVFQSEYLVLDGYDGRYEEPEKPKGWNGKVVCVETHDVGFVSGAIYSVIGGALRDKDGEFRPDRSGAAFFMKFDDINRAAYGKFIEFKGEANAK